MKGKVFYILLAITIAFGGVLILAGVASASSPLEPASPDCWNKITVEKITEPAGGTGFNFTLVWGSTTNNFTLDHGQSKTYSPNSWSVFTITEAAKAGYYLKAISCSGPTGVLFTYDLPNRRVIIDLKTNKVDGNVTCTFTNARYGKITVYKFEDLDEDGKWGSKEPPLSDWEFNLTGTNSANGKTNADGKLVFENLKAGSFTVTEQLKQDYYPTTGLSQNGSLNPGGDITLYFGNRRHDMDYGDLTKNISGIPAYPLTLFADDGARHKPKVEGDAWLGSLRDLEYDGLPDSGATGDDGPLPSENDEDGVKRGPSWGGGVGAISVTVSGEAGCLMGWVDFAKVDTENKWVDFGPDFQFTEVISDTKTYNEKVIDNLYVSSGTHAFTFDLPYISNYVNFFARFRLSPLDSQYGIDETTGQCNQPAAGLRGLVEGGEVEDYYWSFGPTAVELKKVSAIPQRSALDVGIITIVSGIIFAAMWISRRLRRYETRKGDIQ